MYVYALQYLVYYSGTKSRIDLKPGSIFEFVRRPKDCNKMANLDHGSTLECPFSISVP